MANTKKVVRKTKKTKTISDVRKVLKSQLEEIKKMAKTDKTLKSRIKGRSDSEIMKDISSTGFSPRKGGEKRPNRTDVNFTLKSGRRIGI